MRETPWGIGILAEIFQKYSIDLIGIGSYLLSELDPNFTLALYNADIDAGTCDDGRVTYEMTFPASSGKSLCLRTFSPGSGCDVAIEDDKIAYTEQGLRGFVGKRAGFFDTSRDVLLIVWSGEMIGMTDDDAKAIVQRLRGLNQGFC